VPRGKLEVYGRKEKPLNAGWAIDENGHETLDPKVALKGALLPLGASASKAAATKATDSACWSTSYAACSRAARSAPICRCRPTVPSPARFHTSSAPSRSDGFRDPAQFKADMDTELRGFKESAKSPGHDRIYVAGEIEYENTLKNREHGVPVHVKVWDGLQKLAAELDLPFEVE